MFYHSRELEHVVYGRVKGFVEKGDWLISAYRWLGSYCEFYPQVWLSRSSSNITGKRRRDNGVLFGFDYIKGFPVDLGEWENVLSSLTDERRDIKSFEKRIIEYFKETHELDDKEGLMGEDRIFPVRDYEEWRDKYLFVENDQVVVPRLNLKSAKEIICRNERQRKLLRKMGFIEDRIKIMNFKKAGYW